MSKRGEKMQAEVLGVLREHRGAMSAYDVLGQLRETNEKLAPATIYRALASLTDRGSVHRLESLNAFIACQCDGHKHASILSICEDCGAVQEIDSPEFLNQLTGIASESGFVSTRHVIEILGQCAACTGAEVQA